jgi:Fe-S-cluster containining protein
MPSGKPAGVRCVNLTVDNRCAIYDARPAVCRRLRPSREMCGESTEDAMKYLTELERLTTPENQNPKSKKPK